MRVERSAVAVFALVVVIVCSARTTKADSVVFTIGNHPQANEENVLLNGGSMGTTVFGAINQTQIQVSFTSSTDTLLVPSNGQARLEPLDGVLNNVSISIPGATFHDIIFNPFFGSGTANITVLTANNAALSFAYELGNGQNFLTIVAGIDTSILSVTIDAPSGFTDLRQVRISGPIGAITEPISMVLFGLGLAGVAAAMRKRR
jgi:PEP-CTERM motif